jgi:ATP-dependent protease ClpP protease subunit
MKLKTILSMLYISYASSFSFSHINFNKHKYNLKEVTNNEEDYKIIYPNNNFEEYNNNSNIIAPKLDVLFYGSVTDESCLQLTNALNTLDKISKKNSKSNYIEPISLHIQSYGGMLMPSFYVCDFIKNLDTPVHTYIDGYAASAATLISVCGDKRYTTRFSKMLIHQLSTGYKGKALELQDGIENVNLFMDNIKTIYLENSYLDINTLNNLLSRDIWLNSTKCLEYGLIDEII